LSVTLDDVLDLPVVGAPLGGGPGTPALAAAVSEAGGLGFLAAGYKPADAVAAELVELRSLTARPFGLNIFYPVRDEIDAGALAAYVRSLRGEEERYGVTCGESRWSDDDWDAKLALAIRDRPAVVSFTFGCPEREVVEELRTAGSAVWATVTTPAEAEVALGRGVDGLVLQGAEAGGHQGAFAQTADEPLSVLSLLRLVRPMTDLPLIAAGGVGSVRAIGEVRAAGAAAAQIGTAFLLAPEAGTSEPHRRALKGEAPTRLTRAFTGRPARGIVNRFMREHEPDAPAGYPEIHYVTAPLRAKARELGDADGLNLWAGQSYRLTREEPAAAIVEHLASGGGSRAS
jgi:nitronate monooxygenase